MPEQPSSSNDPPRAAALLLAAELKQIRLALPGKDRGHMTQEQMAALILVGGKPVISLYESAGRLPTEATLRRYADAGSRDPSSLLQLRAMIRSGAAFSNPLPEPAVEPSVVVPRLGMRRRWFIATAALAVVAAGATSIVILQQTSQGHVVITLPRHQSVLETPVKGTVSGYSHDDLWIDVQAVNGDRHHPTDGPCDRFANTFDFSTIYLGRPSDQGREFRISVVATPIGSNADRALIAYGQRPKNRPNTYVGLQNLPPGSEVVDSILVRRT